MKRIGPTRTSIIPCYAVAQCEVQSKPVPRLRTQQLSRLVEGERVAALVRRTAWSRACIGQIRSDEYRHAGRCLRQERKIGDRTHCLQSWSFSAFRIGRRIRHLCLFSVAVNANSNLKIHLHCVPRVLSTARRRGSTGLRSWSLLRRWSFAIFRPLPQVGP